MCVWVCLVRLYSCVLEIDCDVSVLRDWQFMLSQCIYIFFQISMTQECKTNDRSSRQAVIGNFSCLRFITVRKKKREVYKLQLGYQIMIY